MDSTVRVRVAPMIVLALLLAAAAPPAASKADPFVSGAQWEELYLAFAAAPVGGYSAADRTKLAVALTQGCVALESKDPVMAISLGEKAVDFEATADALLCVGKSGQKTDQRSAAEAALRKGAAAFAKDGRFPLELGRLAISENDGDAAVAVLANVPKKSAESKEADALMKRAQALQAEAKSAKGGFTAQERELRRRQDAAGKGGGAVQAPAAAPAPPANKVFMLRAGERTRVTMGSFQGIAVGDSKIAEARTVGGYELEIEGVASGQTPLMIWREDGKQQTYTIVVQ